MRSGLTSHWTKMLRIFAEPRGSAASQRYLSSAESIINTSGIRFCIGTSVNSAVFSPDGERVLTASQDGTARVWDATSGKPLGEPMEHGENVLTAVFSADGQRVFTASQDGTARVWNAYCPAQTPECLADWAEAVGGWRLNDAGGLTLINDPVEKLARLRELSARLPPDNPCALVAGWIFPPAASSRN